MKIDCIIGITLGKNRDLAIWRPNHKTEIVKMPSEIMELKSYFECLQEICNPIVFVEKILLKTDDITDNPDKLSQVQRIQTDFEKLKTILTMCAVPFVLVHPMKWQDTLNLRIKGEEKLNRKKRYQQTAQEYYPEVKVTLRNADTLMICTFGRYMLRNGINWILENLPKPLHPKLF